MPAWQKDATSRPTSAFSSLRGRSRWRSASSPCRSPHAPSARPATACGPGSATMSGCSRVLTSLGFTNAATLRMAAEPERESEWLGALVGVRIAVSLVVVVLCAISIPLFLTSTDQSHAVAQILNLTTLSTGADVADDRLPVAPARRTRVVVHSCCRPSCGSPRWWSLWALDASVVGFAVANLLVVLIVSVLQVRVTRRLADIAWRAGLRLWRPLMRVAIPLGIASVMITIYYQVDSVLLAADRRPRRSRNIWRGIRVPRPADLPARGGDVLVLPRALDGLPSRSGTRTASRAGVRRHDGGDRVAVPRRDDCAVRAGRPSDIRRRVRAGGGPASDPDDRLRRDLLRLDGGLPCPPSGPAVAVRDLHHHRCDRERRAQPRADPATRRPWIGLGDGRHRGPDDGADARHRPATRCGCGSASARSSVPWCWPP